MLRNLKHSITYVERRGRVSAVKIKDFLVVKEVNLYSNKENIVTKAILNADSAVVTLGVLVQG